MDLFRRYGNLLRPDGTNQLQRLLPGLEADYVVPDERAFSDLVQYAYQVAAGVRYYDLNGQATGDWRALFESLMDTDPVTGASRAKPTEDLQMLLALRDDWPPHLVLFLTFLRLFQHLQEDFNTLTQKHLLHYYEKELGLLRRTSARDDVHVIFELARGAAATLLPAGTLLDAGKDVAGHALVYSTQNEIVVSAASVADMRRIVIERDQRGLRRFFVAEGFVGGEGPSGNTFGARQLELDAAQRFMTEAQLGFVVAAPVLHMAEGERRIEMIAHLRLPAGAPPLLTQGVTASLEISLSGPKGWVPADSFEATLLANGGGGQPALSLIVNLGATAPAIVAVNPALHGAGLAGARAALRVQIKGATGIYEIFDGITVDSVDFNVQAKGVRNLVVQNDEAKLDAKKPMQLFGSQPRLGSTFHVGSAEVFGKRLTDIRVNLEWKAPPDDLMDHYRGYFDLVNGTLGDSLYAYFSAEIDLLHERSWRSLLVNQGLFKPAPTELRTLSANAGVFALTFAGVDYRELPDLEQPESFDGTSRFGFMRMRLTGPTRASLALYSDQVPFEAFGHPVFAQRYALQAIKLSNAPASGVKLPKEPYTPVLASLSIDYTATATMSPENPDANAVSRYFVLGPFGARMSRTITDARLVPVLDGTATLLLGLRDFAAPGNISLLFDIDVGTATAAEPLRSGEAEWSYLAAQDVWRTLGSAAVLIDGTQGFQRPGVVSITVPGDASRAHRSMPADLVWLRVLIRRSPESAARTLSVTAHGALATFEPGSLPLTSFEQHLAAGLPRDTIGKLLKREPGIARTRQPGVSFGGRGEESTGEFIRRSSERLRHRNRAVTPWDVERLVLERFPEVFKVKCLPHTDESGVTRAGHTAVVIVPNLQRASGTNPLEPRAGEVLLAQIAEYLEGRTTPFLALHVIQPAFERLRVEAKVVFTHGRDPGYHAVVLNDDLRRFLSPWAYQDGEDILFGTRIYRSELLAFIESRDYVDHVVGLRLYHNYAGVVHQGIGATIIGVDFIVHPRPRPALQQMAIADDLIVGRPIEVAQTTQAHAILVSHPSHLVMPVASGAEICSGVTRLGIGYMTVGLDFNVDLEVPA